MNGGIKLELASQWFAELLQAEKNHLPISSIVEDIETELKMSGIRKMYLESTLTDPLDIRFLDVIGFARALKRGDLEVASEIKMRLLGIKPK